MRTRTVAFAGSIALLGLAVTTEVDPTREAPASVAAETRTSISLPALPETPTLRSATVDPNLRPERRPEPAMDIDEETLWLARAIYSETKRPHEQELVAWVIRNRVETAYRGQTTYRGVILDPYQFSAFNPNATNRAFFMGLTPDIAIPQWRQSLWIAHYVRHADPSARPFSMETRHFFSERSMQRRPVPIWADQRQFVPPRLPYEVEEDRFRFYEKIS